MLYLCEVHIKLRDAACESADIGSQQFGNASQVGNLQDRCYLLCEKAGSVDNG